MMSTRKWYIKYLDLIEEAHECGVEFEYDIRAREMLFVYRGCVVSVPIDVVENSKTLTSSIIDALVAFAPIEKGSDRSQTPLVPLSV